MLAEKQRPWTNALGGLYLPCLNRMLGHRWVDGRDEALRWYTSESEKVAGGSPHPRGEVFTPWGGGVISDISTRGR